VIEIVNHNSTVEFIPTEDPNNECECEKGVGKFHHETGDIEGWFYQNGEKIANFTAKKGKHHVTVFVQNMEHRCSYDYHILWGELLGVWPDKNKGTKWRWYEILLFVIAGIFWVLMLITVVCVCLKTSPARRAIAQDQASNGGGAYEAFCDEKINSSPPAGF